MGLVPAMEEEVVVIVGVFGMIDEKLKTPLQSRRRQKFRQWRTLVYSVVSSSSNNCPN